MASVMDTRSDTVKRGEGAAEALRMEIRLRRQPFSNVSSQPASPSQIPGSRPHIIRLLQQASEKTTSGSTSGEDTRNGLNVGSGEASINARSKVLLGQSSMPTPRCTTEPCSLKGARTGTLPAAVGGTKKRRRPSKRPKTSLVTAEPKDFRNLVQRLTGGTFFSQSSGTSSSILSSDLTAEAYVGRPQPLRPSAIVTTGDIPAAPVTADTSADSQELPELPAFLFQGSELGSYNDFMGYTNSSLWDVMASTFMATESLGVSNSSSKFQPDVFTSDMMKPSVYKKESTCMPLLPEETDGSHGGGPYQEEAGFSCESGDLQTDLSDDASVIMVDAWLAPENSLKVYNNQPMD